MAIQAYLRSLTTAQLSTVLAHLRRERRHARAEVIVLKRLLRNAERRAHHADVDYHHYRDELRRRH